jgi:peptidoglycan hydrolase-like protein with peptidoglycan-binding domain
LLAALACIPLVSFAAQVATPQTDDEVGTGTYCPALTQTLRRGMRDANTSGQVTELQTFLADYFDLDEGVAVSGFFGKATQRTVIQFQQKNGLPASGVAGSMMRAKIAEVCKGGTVTTVDPKPACADPATYQRPRCTEDQTLVTDERTTQGCVVPPYCKDRARACPGDVYAPVCGAHAVGVSERRTGDTNLYDSDRTYSNECSLKADKAVLRYKGECRRRGADGSECPTVEYQACPAGTTDVSTRSGASRCPQQPICKKNATVCPTYPQPRCGLNDPVVSVGNSEGCTQSFCKSTAPKCGISTFQSLDRCSSGSSRVYVQCYDGSGHTLGNGSLGAGASCKSDDAWKKNAEELCTKKCAPVQQWEPPSNDGPDRGAQGVGRSTQLASPYEAFMWVVRDQRKLGN